ncbi:MAG: D-3-phosphoglycerate dehydrogenase [Chloroflexota bacterium]
MAKILVADKIAQQGIDLLKQEHEVEVRTGLKEDDLVQAMKGVQALIVRSQTQVTKRVIEAGDSLVVIARAGVGVDNVDVPAATAQGVIVVNAPLANTLSTAEHAFGLLLACARNIPQGHQSLRNGAWDRAKYQGVELSGKTLGIVGLGRIGTEVARRARAFEMRVVAYDPFVSNERASALGVEMRELDDLLAESDFVTLHTALHEGNRGMMNAERFAKMKQGARLINAARGALVDEQALYDAVESGHLGGAGIDVFSEEPAVGNVLTTTDKIVVTPHLAASTNEAQDRAAIDVAEQVLEIFAGQAPRFPVNVPTVDAETMSVLGPFLEAARVAGRVASQLASGNLQKVRVEYLGEIGTRDTTPMKAAVVTGMLDEVSTERVSAVNALATAEAHGLRLEEDALPAQDPYANLLVVRATTDRGEERVAVTNTPIGPSIVAINDYPVEVSLGAGSPNLLAIENIDRPGQIGKVGTMLGEWGVNISSMSVSPSPKGAERALMILGIGSPLTPEQMDAVAKFDGIFSVRQIRLR